MGDTVDHLPTVDPVAEKGAALDLLPAAEAAAGVDVPGVNIATTGLDQGEADPTGGLTPVLKALLDHQGEDLLPPPVVTLDILPEMGDMLGVPALEAGPLSTPLVIPKKSRRIKVSIRVLLINPTMTQTTRSAIMLSKLPQTPR